jgi:hypothetical protein
MPDLCNVIFFKILHISHLCTDAQNVVKRSHIANFVYRCRSYLYKSKVVSVRFFIDMHTYLFTPQHAHCLYTLPVKVTISRHPHVWIRLNFGFQVAYFLDIVVLLASF